MKKPTPIDEEYLFDSGVIINSTDLKGIITYTNRKFYEVSGYDKNELIGTNQNIVRHPDMPKAIFRDIWSKIQSGAEWTGVIKNLRKDGRYYWVYTTIVPIYEDDKIIGYSASRKGALPAEIEEAKTLYKELLEQERGV